MWKSVSSSHIANEGSDSSVDSVTTSSSMSQMSSHHGSEHSTTGSFHVVGRKKRRGMIEKRRRDRINNSLNELRRLVPAAFEKQGSAKLEKAEILQMTVDHLTMLHAKGFDAFSFDPHKFAMDYHSIGFRECASETARYMVAVEGMDLQDPLRLRMMSHLQCYAAQRELALKSSAHASVWNPSAFTTPMPYTATSSSVASASHVPTSSSSVSSLSSDLNVPYPGSHSGLEGPGLSASHMMPPPPPMPLFVKSTGGSPESSSSSQGQGGSYGGSGGMTMGPHHHHQMGANGHHQYFPNYAHPGAPGSGQYVTTSGSMKPYRPWGAELAGY